MAHVTPTVRSPRKVKVGINGFGRIGRLVFRVLYERPDEFEVVAVNDLTNDPTIEYLLDYDTTFGRFAGKIEPGAPQGEFFVDGRRVAVFSESDPARIPWAEHGVELVLDSTGAFRNSEALRPHIDKGGARRVVLSAPAKKGPIDATVVLGVNDDILTAEHRIVSNASCTTNCLAPVAKLLHERCGIVRGTMTTVHAFTNDQRLAAKPHSDPRRSRAAAQNIIPTTTGAAKAVGVVLPNLKGRLDGIALRVPVPDGSVVQLVTEMNEDVTCDGVRAAMKEAAEGPMKGIMQYSNDPLVSTDILGNPHSSIFDANYTQVTNGKILNTMAWYDNEWGYSNRVCDLITKLHALG